MPTLIVKTSNLKSIASSTSEDNEAAKLREYEEAQAQSQEILEKIK
jgi:N-acetylmuramoyl-L-alanine amidase CwlA